MPFYRKCATTATHQSLGSHGRHWKIRVFKMAGKKMAGSNVIGFIWSSQLAIPSCCVTDNLSPVFPRKAINYIPQGEITVFPDHVEKWEGYHDINFQDFSFASFLNSSFRHTQVMKNLRGPHRHEERARAPIPGRESPKLIELESFILFQLWKWQTLEKLFLIL